MTQCPVVSPEIMCTQAILKGLSGLHLHIYAYVCQRMRAEEAMYLRGSEAGGLGREDTVGVGGRKAEGEMVQL